MIEFENSKLIKKFSQRYENRNTFVARITRRTQRIIVSREFANAGIESDTVFYYQSNDRIIISTQGSNNAIPYFVWVGDEGRKQMTLPAYVNDLIFEKVDPAIRMVAIKIHIEKKQKVLYFSLSDDILELA